MLAGTESSVLLKVTETGGTNYMEIQLKNAIITDYSDPLSTVGRLTQSVTFTGLASSTTEALQVEIQNTLNAANALNT
jgi:type VI protein secretion system component Hcp